MRGAVRLLLIYALMRAQLHLHLLNSLYRKGGLLYPEEEGIIRLRRVGENLPINMT
jgi:hypothetical protein